MLNPDFWRKRTLLLLAFSLLASGCKPHGEQTATPKPLSVMAQLGQKLFFDPSLSASGKQSCSSCHNPAHAFAPDNNLAVQIGGPGMNLPGQRAVPSLGYLNDTPNFSIGPESPTENDPHLPVAGNSGGNTTQAITAHSMPQDPTHLGTIKPAGAKTAGVTAASANMVPQGGFFWDGRADTLQGQALGPLLNPLEMGNASPQELAARLHKVAYLGDIVKLAGPGVQHDDRLLVSESLFAIARYEAEEPGFHAYNSKYDQYLAGTVGLSEAEARGLKLFEDPKKGNCAACHLDKKTPDGLPPAFTDYQFEALGLPRNKDIPANADTAYYDLGVCGPARSDSYAQQTSNCGLFKTPTLRNVATRHAFFHNGVFHSLEDVLRFYAERDIHPEKFYPHAADGHVAKFDDLPAKYQGNVDVTDAPFDRKPGDPPALNEADIKDLIAFLNTLTDGYKAP